MGTHHTVRGDGSQTSTSTPRNDACRARDPATSACTSRAVYGLRRACGTGRRPTEDDSKRRVVPFMAILIGIPLACPRRNAGLGVSTEHGTLAEWRRASAPSPTPTPSVPAPTPAAVLPTPQPPNATPAPIPAQAPRPAAPLPTPQAKIPTPQPLAPIPTPQAPALAPPPVQAPAPAAQIPQLPIGSLPAIIPGMPAPQNPAQLPATATARPSTGKTTGASTRKNPRCSRQFRSRAQNPAGPGPAARSSPPPRRPTPRRSQTRA